MLREKKVTVWFNTYSTKVSFDRTFEKSKFTFEMTLSFVLIVMKFQADRKQLLQLYIHS